MIVVYFSPKILKDYFDIKVREQCRSCKRYNKKVTCPEHVESIDYYYSLLPTYKEGIFCYKSFPVTDYTDWAKLGKASSLEMHKYLLEERQHIMNDNVPFVSAYAAGSCKLCDDICSFPCRNPAQSLVPIEATGINVVKLAKELADIDIVFPVKDKFYRCGMILYG